MSLSNLKFKSPHCQALLKCPLDTESLPALLSSCTLLPCRGETHQKSFFMRINCRVLVVACGKIWWLHTVLPIRDYVDQCRLLEQTGNTRLSSSGTERRVKSSSAAEEAMLTPNHPWQAGWSPAQQSKNLCVFVQTLHPSIPLTHAPTPMLTHAYTPSVYCMIWEWEGYGEGWTWLRKHPSGSTGASSPSFPT